MTFFNDEKVQGAWERASKVEGLDSDMYRKDACGALIMKDKYGKQNPYGWEIDHIYPQDKGGDDHPDNLRALHYLNNRSKSNDYPSYASAVKFDGSQNVSYVRNMTVNEKVRQRLATLYHIK